MKHLLNTLYITSEDIYLSLDGENVVANREREPIARFPLHTLQDIITFSYSGASPALMGACAKRNIGFAFCNQRGRFLARVNGESNGNVLLRREQYRIAEDDARSVEISKNMIFGKIYNSRWSIERTCRDHSLRVDTNKLRNASGILKLSLEGVLNVLNLEELRGVEGSSATVYFGILDDMILNNKETFCFKTRNRRPPLDPVNAMLSFAYSLLNNDCASALESVGLDSYVGFLHRDRPGRSSLSLDLMEELRPCIADRFVISFINNRRVNESDFIYEESGAVFLTDSARKTFLNAWQEKKKETIKHPYLEEKMEWGLVPYIQAKLLTRYIRGDIDGYPPFLWK